MEDYDEMIDIWVISCTINIIYREVIAGGEVSANTSIPTENNLFRFKSEMLMKLLWRWLFCLKF